MTTRWRHVLERVGLRSGIDAGACELSLRIEPTSIVLQSKQMDRVRGASVLYPPRLAMSGFLTNNGDRPVTLVMPGDGSRMGRRTPVLEWTFAPGGRLTGFEGCGNINELREGEVFVLQPSESRNLGARVAPLALPLCRSFRGVLVYANEPELPFRGALLRAHDEAELARLRTSNRCRIHSNEIDFLIEGDPLP